MKQKSGKITIEVTFTPSLVPIGNVACEK